MKKAIGWSLLFLGIATIVLAMTMDTTVSIGGLPARVVGTTYGTTTLPEVPIEQVHNVGLMQRQQNFLILGGLISISGVLIILLAPSRRSDTHVSSDAQQIESVEQLSEADWRRFGVTQDGDKFVWGGRRFASPEAALMFAKSRA